MMNYLTVTHVRRSANRALLVVALMIGFVCAPISPDRALASFSVASGNVPNDGTGVVIELAGGLGAAHSNGSAVTATDFALTVGGSPVTGFSVTVQGQTQLRLTLTGAAVIYQNQAVTLTYTQPNTGQLLNVNNEPLESFSLSTSLPQPQLITNNSIQVSSDTTPPALASGTAPSLAANGTALTLTFDEQLNAAMLPAAGAFTVLAGGSAVTVSSVANSGSTSVLTLASAIAQGATVTVAYTAPQSGGFQDAVGNLTASFSAQTVNNSSTVDATAPALASGTAPSLAANGTELTLTFDEALASATPAVGDFTVLAGGSAVAVSSVANSGSTSVLTLASAIAQGATVTVAYTAPQSGGIQDAAGNLTATFTAQAVTNNSTVPAPSSGGGSSDTTSTTVASPSSGGGSSETTSTTSPVTESTTPSRITADNQELFVAEPGAAKAVVNGVEVAVSITNAGDDTAGSTAPEDRSPEQVSELQDTADTIVTVLDEAAGGDSGLSVVDTETGAEIEGIFDDVRVPVEDVIVAEAGEFAGLYASRDENGNPVKIRAEILEMERGGEVAVIVYGLPAGEDVELVLMSTPYLLGTVTTDSTGGFTRMVGPPDSVLAGDHTLVTASETVTVSLGIRITDPSATTEAADTVLPATGSPAPVGLFIALIVGGAVLVMVSRRRSGAID